MAEISTPGRKNTVRGQNAKSVVRAAQELSGLDGGFEVFLNGSPSKGGRNLASHAVANKGSPVMRLLEKQHSKIKQNLANAYYNQGSGTTLQDKGLGHSQTRSKDHLLSSINEDATKAT